jgi:hypothetical protein
MGAISSVLKEKMFWVEMQPIYYFVLPNKKKQKEAQYFGTAEGMNPQKEQLIEPEFKNVFNQMFKKHF